MRVKRSVAIVAACLSILILSSPVTALPYFGPFAHWHSDLAWIGRLERSSNTVGLGMEHGTAMTPDNLVAYTNHALMAWPLRHHTYTYTPDYDNARLIVTVITRATANSLGFPPSTVGANIWVDAYISAIGSYGGFTKNIFTVPRYQTFLIWDSGTMHFSTNQWRNVSAHEHGHGIGYAGHSSNPATLMFPFVSSITMPQLEDKQHMRNMYIID